MTFSSYAKQSFSGVITATVTPFRDGRVDLPAFCACLERQAKAGVGGIVVCGTTGEASTLTGEERDTLIKEAALLLHGKLPLIIGCGTNDTRTTVRNAERAAESGADYLLVVTPYYNKGTESGIVSHFLAVADASPIPIILYNIPGRTGVDLSIAQYEKLAVHPRIIGVKEAKGDIGRIGDLIALFGDKWHIYTGNDTEFLPTLALGGDGVISVLSNLYPADAVAAYRLFESGKPQEAAAIMRRYQKLSRLLFREVNPAPVKEAMAQMGLCSAETRLPLSRVSTALAGEIEAELTALSRP